MAPWSGNDPPGPRKGASDANCTETPVAVLLLLRCRCIGDAAPDRDGDRVISGVGVVAPDGSICHGMAVVVNAEGQVSGVIPADQADPALIDLIAPEGSVITPGLHDLLGALGATGALTAGTLLLDPNLRAADAFDSTDPHLEDAAAPWHPPYHHRSCAERPA